MTTGFLCININALTSLRRARSMLAHSLPLALNIYAKVPLRQARSKHSSTKLERGFTLIELSIVMVIIGLIAGAITNATSLVHAARIHSQIQQFNQYQLAVNAFELQYNALPGDMPVASRYWPTASDGNGDRILDKSNGTPYAAEGNFDEEFAGFFQHLSLAGLTKTPFDGSAILGQGFPKMALDNSKGMVAANAWWYSLDGCGGRGIKLSMTINVPENMPNLDLADSGSSLAVTDLYKIDRKIDDGNAIKGSFCAHNVSAVPTGLCHENGVYNIDGDGSCHAGLYTISR